MTVFRGNAEPDPMPESVEQLVIAGFGTKSLP
jgi:hypothetical protein